MTDKRMYTGWTGAVCSCLLIVLITGQPAAQAAVVACNEAELLRAMPGGDRYDGSITFECDTSYPEERCIDITSSEIHISQDLLIDGEIGVDARVTLNGGELPSRSIRCTNGGGANAGHRLFRVDPGVTLKLKNLEITGFSASDGDSELHSAEDDGGTVLNYGTVELDSVFIGDSEAEGRGGVILNAGTLLVRNSVFGGAPEIRCSITCFGGMGTRSGLGRHVHGGGGAIAAIDINDAPVFVEILDSEIYNGEVRGGSEGGGGLYARSLNGHVIDIKIQKTNLYFNSSVADGAALAIGSANVVAKIEDSSVFSNRAHASGGGIDNQGGSITIDRSVLVNNFAGHSGGGRFATQLQRV